ncbi:hypothetical protein [Oceanobacillus halotolerans]|uniref:hypothetical protein n=1 Tax=Oceanobacillus halotolerans TaxID=2663380 RepID=UPI0013DA6D76|nr:hypothetical protein [Oceanobacillus halotolerans]
MKWLVKNKEGKYQLNFASYSSLFINHTTDTESFIKPVIQYFQPRNKVRGSVLINDITNDFEEVTHQRFQAFELSNQGLKDTTQLGSKSLLKSQLKNEFLNHIETDGYLLTINTLINDLIETTVKDLPVRSKDFNIDLLLKLLEVDFDLDNRKECNNTYLHQNKILLPVIKKYLSSKFKDAVILFFMFPEDYLSPREQLEMKHLLTDISNGIQVFVITKSKYFLSDNLDGSNYFIYGEQLFTNEFLEDMEWEGPLSYDRAELLKSLIRTIKNHVDVFELNPLISNYKQADIVLFQSIDLYVLIFLMKKLKFKFELDIDPKTIDTPVFDYIMDVYEKL